MSDAVFISGVSGYLGHALVPLLRRHGIEVRGVVRPGSRVPQGCHAVQGDALQSATFAQTVKGCGTLVHLTGARHPAPWKRDQFEAIDWVSLRASLQAAVNGGVSHFVYVSVAQPAPVMKDYIAVRQRCETAIRESGISSTVLRPWYVLGPGHRWPVVLRPLYSLLEAAPPTRKGALRLGLVTLAEMASALEQSVLNPATDIRIVDVPSIRELAKQQRSQF